MSTRSATPQEVVPGADHPLAYRRAPVRDRAELDELLGRWHALGLTTQRWKGIRRPVVTEPSRSAILRTGFHAQGPAQRRGEPGVVPGPAGGRADLLSGDLHRRLPGRAARGPGRSGDVAERRRPGDRRSRSIRRSPTRSGPSSRASPSRSCPTSGRTERLRRRTASSTTWWVGPSAGTFVIDRDGIVRWKVVNAIPDARDHAEYARALAELAGTEPCRVSVAGPARTIPQRGPSPWKRGSVGGRAGAGVPGLPAEPTGRSGLERCPACDGVRLSKTLGVLRCSACGWSGELPVAATGEAPSSAMSNSPMRCSAALDRVLVRRRRAGPVGSLRAGV